MVIRQNLTKHDVLSSSWDISPVLRFFGHSMPNLPVFFSFFFAREMICFFKHYWNAKKQFWQRTKMVGQVVARWLLGFFACSGNCRCACISVLLVGCYLDQLCLGCLLGVGGNLGVWVAGRSWWRQRLQHKLQISCWDGVGPHLYQAHRPWEEVIDFSTK